ncbi:hypothetical protein SDC9_86748 [bioreactor metagenome]|uniref:Uncharacterized protein n=1 Tax=bioreactor metagenome TaxID=1076179 RepID=A0A644ZGX7_9ZZZZ
MEKYHVQKEREPISPAADSQIKPNPPAGYKEEKDSNPNRNHNIKKEGLGPNTKR